MPTSSQGEFGPEQRKAALAGFDQARQQTENHTREAIVKAMAAAAQAAMSPSDEDKGQETASVNPMSALYGAATTIADEWEFDIRYADEENGPRLPEGIANTDFGYKAIASSEGLAGLGTIESKLSGPAQLWLQRGGRVNEKGDALITPNGAELEYSIGRDDALGLVAVSVHMATAKSDADPQQLATQIAQYEDGNISLGFYAGATFNMMRRARVFEKITPRSLRQLTELSSTNFPPTMEQVNVIELARLAWSAGMEPDSTTRASEMFDEQVRSSLAAGAIKSLSGGPLRYASHVDVPSMDEECLRFAQGHSTHNMPFAPNALLWLIAEDDRADAISKLVRQDYQNLISRMGLVTALRPGRQ